LKCKGAISDLAKGWEEKGKSWSCSIYCFCKECEFREVTEGAKIEIWQAITKVGIVTKSGILSLPGPNDCLLDYMEE
jgi:hypothetical protein